MTTPTKATAAKKAAAPKATGTTFDFSKAAAAAKAAELPKRGGGRTRQPNPFDDVLKASYDQRTTRNGRWYGQGKSITVPKDAAPDAVNLIRGAANFLGYGSTITDINDPEWQRPGNQVEIRFAAQQRKQRGERSAKQ